MGANSLDTSQHGTWGLEEKLDAINRRILDDQARLGKQANEQIANAIQGISRVESQLMASALDPPSRNSSFYITDERRTNSTVAPSEPISLPQQMVSPAVSSAHTASAAAYPPQMVSPQMASRSPPRGTARPGRSLGVSDMVPAVETLLQQKGSTSPQVSPQQTASPQMASRSPQPAMARGWSREEVHHPMYAGGL